MLYLSTSQSQFPSNVGTFIRLTSRFCTLFWGSCFTKNQLSTIKQGIINCKWRKGIVTNHYLLPNTFSPDSTDKIQLNLN